MTRKGRFYSDGKGQPIDDRGSYVWYHGSPVELLTLAPGSSITRNRSLAEAFSHKPSLLSVGDNGSIKHNGTRPGYLYTIDESFSESEGAPHPAIGTNDLWEWITNRPLRLKLIGRTDVKSAGGIRWLQGRLMILARQLGTRFR
jgi:hypothetical protein